jgi:nitroreductase
MSQVLTVTDAANTRRSIRKYQNSPLSRAALLELLRIATRAPSPWNLQPWRFVVVEDAAVKAQLREAAFGQPQVGAAPAVIVMYSDMLDALATVEETVHPGMAGPGGDVSAPAASIRANFAKYSDADREAWGFAEANIALGYLLLAATAHGFGTSPMLGFAPEKVKAVLGLPEHVRIPALVAIGLPAEDGFPQHRHTVDRVARFV